MSEEAVKQALRRCIDRTIDICDDESFNVAVARGKFSRVFDIMCKDKGVDKFIKVCYRTISQKELRDILHFNDGQLQANTIIQLFFWNKNSRKPFYKPKLFYNIPSQEIPPELKRLVK